MQRIIRPLFWSLFALLVLASLYLSAGRFGITQLPEYRADIERILSEHLQQPVSVQRLTARWEGFSPQLYAEHVRLGEGVRAVQVERLHFRPDLLTSLLKWQVHLAAITLDGVQLEIQQNALLEWHLQGVQWPDAQTTPAPFDWQEGLASLQRIDQLSLVNTSIQVQRYAAAPFVVRNLEFTLDQQAHEQRLQARIHLPDAQHLALHAQWRLAAEDWRQSPLAVYLDLPTADWSQWLPAEWLAQLELDEVVLGGQFWLRAEQARVVEAVAQLEQVQVRGHVWQQPLDVLVNSAQAFYSAEQAQQQLWLAELDTQLAADQPSHNWPLLIRHTGALADGVGVLELAAEQVHLEPLMATLQRYLQLPDAGRTILEQLDFHGQLRNTQLRWEPAAAWEQQLQFDTNIHQLAYSPWQHVPGATGISGRIQGNLAQGELQLDSDGFSLYLAKLFADPWVYHRARAHLTWAFDPQGFTLTSPYLQVQGDEGDLAGDFVIRLLTDPALEDYMDLRVGMRDGDAQYTSRYLPLILRDGQGELWQWLHSAIVGGEVAEGYFQYQGALSDTASPNARSISLFFDVHNAELQYQPGWPALTQGRAQVFVHDWGVQVELDSGRILATEVEQASAEVLYAALGEHSTLEVQAQLQSSVQDGLYLLQQTPLAKDATGFADWQGEGDIPAQFTLSIPFAPQQPVHVQLEMPLQNARLRIPSLAVELDQLNSALTFDSQLGLRAKTVSGRFLQQPFKGEIRSIVQPTGWLADIQAQGRMPVTALQRWLQQPAPLPVAGEFAYQLNLSLEPQATQLTLDTDLQGVSIDLPAPLGKTAAAAQTSQLQMTLAEQDTRYAFTYGQQLSARVTVPTNKARDLRGEVVIGQGQARWPEAEGLRVTGQLQTLVLPEWLAAINTELSEQDTGTSLLRELSLQVDELQGFNIPLQGLELRLTPERQAWRLQVQGEQVQGEIRIQPQQPLQVNFERLQLPVGGLQDAQQASQLEPPDIPAMIVKVAQLYLGQERLGSVAFRSQIEARAVRFADLALDLKGLQVSGELLWQYVRQGAMQSRFEGVLQGDDIAQVLAAWAFPPSISSERFQLDVDVQWPGNPLGFALAGLSGQAELKLRHGQLTAMDGGSQALRVFGLLNFKAISRRLRLDFSDLWSKGLAYDRIDGAFDINLGIYRTRTPLILEGISSNLSLEGQLDAGNEQVNAKLLVLMPISNNLPLAAVVVGAPAVGGALFLMDRLTGERFSRMAAVRYEIVGDWDDPSISFSKVSGKELRQ